MFPVEPYIWRDSTGFFYQDEGEDLNGPFPSLEEAKEGLKKHFDYINQKKEGMTFEITISHNKRYRIVTNNNEIIIRAPYHWRSFIERPLEVLVRSILTNLGQVGIRKIEEEKK